MTRPSALSLHPACQLLRQPTRSHVYQKSFWTPYATSKYLRSLDTAPTVVSEDGTTLGKSEKSLGLVLGGPWTRHAGEHSREAGRDYGKVSQRVLEGDSAMVQDLDEGQKSLRPAYIGLS